MRTLKTNQKLCPSTRQRYDAQHCKVINTTQGCSQHKNSPQIGVSVELTVAHHCCGSAGADADADEGVGDDAGDSRNA